MCETKALLEEMRSKYNQINPALTIKQVNHYRTTTYSNVSLEESKPSIGLITRLMKLSLYNNTNKYVNPT